MRIEKRKKIILLLILFLLPSSVKGIETVTLTNTKITKKITNYYYFYEPYASIPTDKSTNYGIFAQQKVGSKLGKIEQVQLKKCNNINSEECIVAFWNDYNNIAKHGSKIGTVEGKKCDISFIQKKTANGDEINKFAHGCYKNNETDDIKASGTKLSEVNTLGMTCSSIIRKADISIANNNIYDYLELKIVRDVPYNQIIVGNFNKNQNSSNCSSNNNNDIYRYNGEIASPVLGKYQYTIDEYNCPRTKAYKAGTCNNSASISQKCTRKTIKATNAQADINYEQTGVVTNLLSPTKIYQGGGVSLGFIYQNTIKWNFVDGTLYKKGMNDSEAREKITSEMRNSLIKSTDLFANELKNNIELSFDGISDNYIKDIKNELQINCQRTGEIRTGKALTTTCTIFMPKTELNYGIGTINKVIGSSSDGITNKIYTELNYAGKTHLNANISKLNMLKVDDSNEWSISFGDINDTSCDIDVEERLYNSGESNKAKYKFIYRPISVNNPFPNRNAGANWYEWWSGSNNKDRLKKSYSDSSLQYQIELNPSSIKKIKESTTIRDYYEWNEDDEKNNNKFVTDNFAIKRQNIIEGGDY